MTDHRQHLTTDYEDGRIEGALDATEGSFSRPEHNPHLLPGQPLRPVPGFENAAALWAYGYGDGFAETAEATS